MLSSGVVAILVAIATIGWVQAEGDYFIVCPNLIRPTQKFECEVSYVGAEASINVEISLRLPGESPLVTKTETVTGYRTFDFTLNTIPEGNIQVSAVGTKMDGSSLFTNKTQIKTEQENSLVFVQTDKPIYKPGERVKIRIVCTDQDLKPVNVPTDITIVDSKDQKLDQKLAAEGDTGVIDFSYVLSDVASLGEWKIRVKSEVATTTKEFTVEKYVLPKFDVKVSFDKKVLVDGADTELKVTVVTRYTYGKAVQGKAKFIFGNGRDAPEPITLTPGADGSHTETFPLSMLQKYKDYQSLRLTVNVTEGSTDVTQMSDEVTIMWYNDRIKMEFLPTSANLYRPGLPFTVFLKLTDIVTNAAPVEKKTVMVSVYFDTKVEKSIDWDNDGLAEVMFDVPSNYNPQWSSGISVTARMKKDGNNGDYYANWYLKKYRAKLNNTLTVELTSDGAIKAGMDFSVKVDTTTTLTQVAYMVLSRGNIAARGMISMSGTTKTFVITATREMSPGAKVFVYGIVTKGLEKEVIADSVDVQVSGVFGDNELTLSFSEAEVRPGANVDVTVNYLNAANAKYYILAVDESVLLMKTGNDLRKADVIKGMMGFSAGMTPTYNDGPEPHGKMVANDMIFPGGGNNNEEPTSAGELLKKRGLVFLSGVYVEAAPPKNDLPVMIEAEMAGGAPNMNKNAEMDDGDPQPPPGATTDEEPTFAAVGRTRSNFKETWMWLAGSVGADGRITITETVPDTITNFVASAFAIDNEKGLAITDDTTPLKVFQPFFVSVALKYSIVRGEIFTLRVSISNYLETATPVQVTLEKSDDFDVVERSADGAINKVSKEVVTTLQVEPGVPAGVTFEIFPKILGEVPIIIVAAPDVSTGEMADRIEKKVLVKPEGFEQKRVESSSLELSPENRIFGETVALRNTDELVSGSRRVYVDACGDVMGKALTNLERLVQQPTGCGEQNMITLVPNIVVHNYLSATDNLGVEIKEKTEEHMKTGYARELTYKLDDGSFSAFGNSDGEGSTWLTAFVMKSFSQAAAHITPDPEMMKVAINWLLNSQESSGMFKSLGRVIHQELMGGSSGGKALTAFVYIALKESTEFLSVDQVNKLQKTMTYLEGLVKNKELRNPYEKAIVVYALKLADSDYTDTLLRDIDQEEKPWDKEEVEPKPVPLAEGRAALFDYRPPEAKPTDIETWSYVLLTYAKANNLADGNTIMKWLIKQQNGDGGFKSTQDTVLGLQALAEYAALAYTAPKTDISLFVTAKAPSGDTSHTFHVQKDKLLLLQSHRFPDDTTAIELYANGSGLAIVNVKWTYNTMKEPMIMTDKKIKGTVEANKISENKYLIRGCVSSPNPDLGMSTLKMNMLSGYSIINEEELSKGNVRVEVNEEDVVIYYNEIQAIPQCADFKVEKSQDLPVSDVQPAAMMVQAYYEPDVFNEILYTVEDSAQVDICTVCQGVSCPSRCPTSASPSTFRGVLLAACISLLVSLIVAL